MKSWYEDERFWGRTAPFQFSEERWRAAPAEVDGLISLLGLSPGASVLDIPCGPGRHSLELARRGFAVTGVDLTAAFIEEAKQRAAADRISAEFIQADMRRFRKAESFDAVINLFTSFGYFADPADDRRVLENFLSSLRPGGKLLIDMVGKEVLARVFRPRNWVERDGALFLEERKLVDGWSRIETRWIIVRDGKQEEFTLKIRLYSGAELTALLKEVGFGEVKLYGSLDGIPYDHGAKRLVAVAAKA